MTRPTGPHPGSPARAPAAFEREAPLLALVLGLSEGAFLQRYVAGARDMARELGMPLLVLEAGGDRAAVPDLVRRAMREGARAVLINHGEGEALRSVVREALAAGVALAAFDTIVDDPRVPEIGQDDLLIGHLLGRQVLQDTGGRAEIIHATAAGYPALERRDRAWEDQRWSHVGLHEVLRVGWVSQRTADDTAVTIAAALAQHPEVTAIVATWDEFARGAVRAVREQGRSGDVRVFGVDVTDQDIQLMVEPGSPWVATVSTDAWAIGRLAVRAAAAGIAGERVPKYLLLQPQVITQAFLRARGIRDMDGLLHALPSLADSPLLWPPWMEALLARAGHTAPEARLTPDELIEEWRQTLSALEGRNQELQATTAELEEARRELERRVAERTAELADTAARLTRSEQFLEQIIGSMAEPLFVKDDQHRIVLANPAFCTLLGRSRDEVLGLTDELIGQPPAHAAIYRANDDAVLRTGTENVSEEPLIDARGRAHQLVTKKTRYLDDSSHAFVVGVIDDVTERRRLETELLQAQKLETVGLLASGVAHDLNNLLTPILAYSTLILEQSSLDPSDREFLQAISEASVRARDLTQRLLAFSRKQLITLRPVDLGDLVRRFEVMLRRTIRENIGLEVATPDMPVLVRADPTQIEQVLLNLAVNAQEAMPAGGVLTIEVAAEPDSEERGGAPPHGLLRVVDTGVGMDEETRARAFEPFFTTKGLGMGTGLGLPTVHGIVERHGGSISLQSAPGRGTVFEVLLPGCAPEAEAAASSAPGPQRGHETILVVEDEPRVRFLARRLVEGLGYRALVADGADTALELARVSPRRAVDVLLTDVVMPRTTGPELYDRLRALWPSLRVLYMSGYATDVIGAHGVVDEHTTVLQKPFTLVDLSLKLRQVLDGAA